MFQLKLCATQEYSPHLLENWLMSMQNARQPIQLTFTEHKGKIKILTSRDLSQEFFGSKSQKHAQPTLKKQLFATQPKGPLLPIKRFSQFEDRINKERIYPMDALVKALARYPNAFINFKFTPVRENTRHRLLKKAKSPHFKAERKFDQWESRAWTKISFRRIWGPLLRKGITRLSHNRSNEEQTQSLHEREDPRTAVLDKLARPLFKVEISLSHNFQSFFETFNLPYLGKLKLTQNKTKNVILSAEELASIMSFPNPKNCESIMETESTAFLPAPPNALQISDEGRKRHLYLLGKTGMGKSSTILHLLQQDFQENRSIILLDPHGDLAKDALKILPEEKQKQVILIDPSCEDFPLALNPVENQGNPTLQAAGLLEMFEALAKGSWGPRLEHILRNVLLTLIISPNTTLLDLPRLLTNEEFCKSKLTHIKDLELRRFWLEEFWPQPEKTRQEHIAPILNKVGPLITSPLTRNIFGQPRSKFSFEKIINQNQNQIVLISLSKGEIGEDSSRMLGMFFISMIYAALLRRAATQLQNRQTLALYIDEFQNFTTPTLISMLSECRKYGLALTIANQYLTQLKLEIQDAVLGNVGSLLAFRLSQQDAEKIAPAFNLTEQDLTNLAPFNAYAKLLKNAQPQALFRFESPMPNFTHNPNTDKLQKISFDRYCRRKTLVEEKIAARYNVRK